MTSSHHEESAPREPSIPMNDLRRMLESVGPEINAAVTDVIASGWWLNGPQTSAWQSELAAYLGVHHAMAVGNGTDALEFAIRAVCQDPNRQVVVNAANCGGYTTTAARRAGCIVRFADVDQQSHLMTLATVAPLLDDSVGAVVVTHLYGRAADVSEIVDHCHARGIAVIEDCAEAIGARTANGRRVGSIGDVAAFSFYPTKNLGALGDAGAVTTQSSAVAGRVRSLHQYGWAGKYEITRDGGRNSRTDEIQAAALRVKLPKLDAWNDVRRSIIAQYRQAAAPTIRVLPAEGPGHVGHLAVLTTNHRAELRAHLHSRGIGNDIHFPVPDHLQPAFRNEYGAASLPTTEYLSERILTIPAFPELRADEVQRICSALGSFEPSSTSNSDSTTSRQRI